MSLHDVQPKYQIVTIELQEINQKEEPFKHLLIQMHTHGKGASKREIEIEGGWIYGRNQLHNIWF